MSVPITPSFLSLPDTEQSSEQIGSLSCVKQLWRVLKITEWSRPLFIWSYFLLPLSSRHELSEYIAAPLFKKQPPQQWVTLAMQHMQQVQPLSPHQARAQFLGMIPTQKKKKKQVFIYFIYMYLNLKPWGYGGPRESLKKKTSHFKLTFTSIKIKPNLKEFSNYTFHIEN